MPRRREVPKREILPDPKFGNVELSKFMNVIMEGGKRRSPSASFTARWSFIEKKKNRARTLSEAFTIAINNVKPMVEVKSRRVGGANYQVPVEVRPVRRLALSMRWIKEAARKRGEKSMALRLANELMEATEGRGGAMKTSVAEANKAFSHFAWPRPTRPSATSASKSPVPIPKPARPATSGCRFPRLKERIHHGSQNPIERYRNIGISATSTPARPRPPSASCSTPA